MKGWYSICYYTICVEIDYSVVCHRTITYLDSTEAWLFTVDHRRRRHPCPLGLVHRLCLLV